MKKVLVLLVAVITLGMAANAQNNLGVRFGGGQGYGAELSWQKGLGSNRLELDLGWGSHDNWTDFTLTGIYQWTGTISGNFGWYAGVGAQLAYWNWANNSSDFALAVAAQAGVEYDFKAVPIQLSLDIRPRFYFIPETNFHWGDIAFGVRYCF